MTIEELLKQREKYDGKEVTVRGYFHGGHEVSELVSKIERKPDKKSEPSEVWRVSKEAKKVCVSGENPDDYDPPFLI